MKCQVHVTKKIVVQFVNRQASRQTDGRVGRKLKTEGHNNATRYAQTVISVDLTITTAFHCAEVVSSVLQTVEEFGLKVVGKNIYCPPNNNSVLQTVQVYSWDSKC